MIPGSTQLRRGWDIFDMRALSPTPLGYAYNDGHHQLHLCHMATGWPDRPTCIGIISNIARPSGHTACDTIVRIARRSSQDNARGVTRTANGSGHAIANTNGDTTGELGKQLSKRSAACVRGADLVIGEPSRSITFMAGGLANCLACEVGKPSQLIGRRQSNNERNISFSAPTVTGLSDGSRAKSDDPREETP